MRIVDLIGFAAIVLVVVLFTLVIARQRYMLRSSGGIPLAMLGRSSRWQYGVGRFAGDELQWFRALGIGTRPSRSLRRDQVQVVERRLASPDDLAALPSGAVIVRCTDPRGTVTLGLSDSAYTGFVSWLEAAAPRF